MIAVRLRNFTNFFDGFQYLLALLVSVTIDEIIRFLSIAACLAFNEELLADGKYNCTHAQFTGCSLSWVFFGQEVIALYLRVMSYSCHVLSLYRRTMMIARTKICKKYYYINIILT